MKKISALSILVLLLVGCTYNRAPITQTLVITQLPTQTRAGSLTPIPSIPHQPTSTRTLNVTISTQIIPTELPTREITPTKTQTPQPTIERVDAEKIVQQYIRDNRGCQLPCWWGIIPGSTTREEVIAFLEPIGRIDENAQYKYLGFYYQLLDKPEGAYVSSTIFFKEGKVSYIYVSSYNGTSQSYKLNQLLSNYGKPDKVGLQAYREVPCGQVPFELFVIYRDKGIIALFTANTQTDGENLKGCFYNPDLWLFDTKDPDLSDLTFFYGGYAGVEIGPMSPPIRSIDQATGMDIETFYQKFQSSNNHCIDTPRNLWPDIEQRWATATALVSLSETVEPQPVP